MRETLKSKGGVGNPWIRATEDASGVILSLVVQPNAKRTEVLGIHDGNLKVRVASPPVDGAANASLCTFLAKEFGVKERFVILTHGTTSRNKIFLIQGVSVDFVLQKFGF